jgi:transcription elongation factor GreA
MASEAVFGQGVCMFEPRHGQMTRSEYEGYRRELERLRHARDHDVPEMLREARTFVSADAVEEMMQLQDDRTIADARIAQLEALLVSATIVEDDASPDVAYLGREVEVEYVGKGRRVTYRLAGSGVSGGPRVVSAGSPVGAALLGRRVGDVVTAELPNGKLAEMRIVDVRTPEAAVAADEVAA